MFNTFDELRDDLQNSLAHGYQRDRDRIAQLLNAINEMERKLKSYYTATIQYVFSEACSIHLPRLLSSSPDHLPKTLSIGNSNTPMP